MLLESVFTRSRCFAALIVLVTVCLSVHCSSGNDSDSHAARHGVAEQSFTTWDDFVAGGDGAQSVPHQVVFIGIDGASWHYIDQLISQDRLPNLARVKAEGAYGTLRSIPSFVSPPAWTTMMTGFLPGQSGIYTFGKWHQENDEFVSVRSDDVCVPFVWDAASRVGRKVAVVNVPVTFPVSEVNGVMISGMLTPINLTNELDVRRSVHDRRDDYLVRPRPRHYGMSGAAMEDTLNLFLFLLYDVVDDGIARPDSVTLRVLSKHEADAADPELGTYRFATNEYSPWIRIRHHTADGVKTAFTKVTCKIAQGENFDIKYSHNLFPIEEQYTYPASLADELGKEFDYYLPTKFLTPQILPRITEDASDYVRFLYDYDDWDLYIFVFVQSDNAHHQEGFGETAAAVYEHIDACIGDIMSSMPANATLVIASDHGFGTFEYGIDPNQMLAQLKLLEWKDKGKIDFDRTLVFHNLYHLYFNHELITREQLQERGISVPEGVDPIEYVEDYIISRGTRILSADGSREFVLEYSQIDPGNLVGDPPNMRVRGAYTDYLVEFWNLRKPRGDVVWELTGTQRWWHRRDGVFLLWGNGVQRGYDAGIKDIQDIAPTMAYLLGVPTGPGMDGRVMYDVLLPELKSDREAYTIDSYRDLQRIVADTKTVNEELLKKLKSLGYVQ